MVLHSELVVRVADVALSSFDCGAIRTAGMDQPADGDVVVFMTYDTVLVDEVPVTRWLLDGIPTNPEGLD